MTDYSDKLNETITTLLGKPISYWIEADRKIHLLPDGGRIFNELVIAEAKVAYYERHIAEMEKFRKHGNGMIS